MLTIDAQTAFSLVLDVTPCFTSVVTVDHVLRDCFSSEEGYFPVAVISKLLVVLVLEFQIKSLFCHQISLSVRLIPWIDIQIDR